MLTENGNYDEIKVRAPDDSEFLLAKRQGSTFIAKCPAIISQHYKDVLLKLRQRFLNAIIFSLLIGPISQTEIKFHKERLRCKFCRVD